MFFIDELSLLMISFWVFFLFSLQLLSLVYQLLWNGLYSMSTGNSLEWGILNLNRLLFDDWKLIRLFIVIVQSIRQYINYKGWNYCRWQSLPFNPKVCWKKKKTILIATFPASWTDTWWDLRRGAHEGQSQSQRPRGVPSGSQRGGFGGKSPARRTLIPCEPGKTVVIMIFFFYYLKHLFVFSVPMQIPSMYCTFQEHGFHVFSLFNTCRHLILLCIFKISLLWR